MTLHRWWLGLGLVAVCLAPLGGCSSKDETTTETPGDGSETGDEAEVVPEGATTLWDQSGVCAAVLKRHEVIRASDYKDGVVRWNCADVGGVTGDDRGQEYCEYHAISAGKPVNSIADVAPGAPVQCLFTSLYADAFADAKGVAKYTKALADKANLGVTPAIAVTQMQVGFNSRGAASALVLDCASQASGTTALFDHNQNQARPKTAAEKSAIESALVEESRQAACWQAANATGVSATKRTALKNACRTPVGKTLTAARWKKAEAQGAKVLKATDAGYDAQRTLTSCLGSYRSGAVTWRNSDNIICERVTRAAAECQCSYAAIPDAFLGFTFGTWTSGSALPPGCRYAKVDGKDNANLVICEPSSSERSDLEVDDRYAGDLNAYCHDRFSTEIVMAAPIRALQASGSCQAGAGFCASYSGK